MAVLRSQFERARGFADAYAGGADDNRWRTPVAAAAAVGGGLAAVVGVAAVGALADAALDAAAGEVAAGAPAGEAAAGLATDGWGEGWDSGWGEAYAAADPGYAADGGAWSHRGDYTDASVGGDGDFFYFIDGDSSLTID